MKLNQFYSTKEYFLEEKEKNINNIKILDLRFIDEFELLFLTTSAGQYRFKKKFNPENIDQLQTIIFEDLQYSGFINSDGKVILKKGTVIEDENKIQ